MTEKVSINMQKGGVGKSTTAINLSAALAQRGHDVLAVDADPQGGLTLKLGYREHYRNADDALYDVLAEQGDLGLDDLDQLILPYEEFDIVPAQMRNFLLEKALYMDSRGYESLKRAIDNLDHSYDYIVIDSPPNLGPLSDGSLIASENVLFPSNPNEISQDSIWLLREEIRTLEQNFGIDIRSIGAVLNEVPTNESVSASVREWFADTFGAENVFEVADRAVIEHAIEYRTSIFAYNAKDAGYPWDAGPARNVCDTYDQLAQHVEANL